MKRFCLIACILFSAAGLLANTNIVKEVISLQKSKVSEQVIDAYVKSQSYNQINHLDIIELTTNGVSEQVIKLLTTNRLQKIAVPYMESERFFEDFYLIPRAKKSRRFL